MARTRKQLTQEAYANIKKLTEAKNSTGKKALNDSEIAQLTGYSASTVNRIRNSVSLADMQARMRNYNAQFQVPKEPGAFVSEEAQEAPAPQQAISPTPTQNDSQRLQTVIEQNKVILETLTRLEDNDLVLLQNILELKGGKRKLFGRK